MVRTTPAIMDRGLHVSAKGRETPFSEADPKTVASLGYHRIFPLFDRNLVSEAIDPRSQSRLPVLNYCDANLNRLNDWRLSNTQTAQLQILDRDQPVELSFTGEMTVPPHDAPYFFRTWLAIHRGQADFRLHMTFLTSGKTQNSVIPFDTTKIGGQNQEGYQEVNVKLPPSEEPTRIALSVAYHSFRPSSEDNSPFLFVACPEVTSNPRSRIGGGPGLSVQDKDPVTNAQWYTAQLEPHLRPSDLPLELVSGKDKKPVFSFADLAVHLREDYGHTLILSANHAGHYAFYLNGKPGFVGYVGTDPTIVRIPPQYLDGGSRHLTVRDISGSVVCFQTVILTPNVLTPEEVLQREAGAPFPGALSVRASHRYAGLKACLANPGTPEDQIQTSRALEILEGGHDNVTLESLSFPKVENPDVSIVIPAHNKVELTYYALAALLLTRDKSTFEVIVVDDASTDETTELEKIVSGIKVVRNQEPQRFIRACNAGVEASSGKFVVLLNNDTEPVSGWLDALVDAFERFPNLGLAGSKLLYPNGELQDAGGIIWGTGNPWNYGNRQNPWDPRYSYARRADYLSGAAMMTTREIWNKVGGLSSYLEPMYFEDTDFAFKVRDAGYETWFVPSSIVYHFEGMTSGTDTSSGFKRYQEVNRPKFKRQWASAYASHGTEGNAPDLEKDRGIVGRVLFIDYTTPMPDRDAGSYAAIQEMKLVQSLGYKVTFLPQNMANMGAYTEALQKDGIEVITAPFYMSVDDFIYARGGEFDAVYITRYYVGEATIPKIRQVAPNTRIILNNADLHFLRELRAGMAQNDAERIQEARRVRESELSVMRTADVVLSYNDVEHSVIQSHTDGAVKVMKCPWVVDLPDTVPGFKERQGMSFLGGFKHHPNEEAVRWFIENVMPGVEARIPGFVFSIYGSRMPDEIKKMASDTIDPAGFVSEVSDSYDQHRVFVAPLLSGAGIKGKVISALAHGIPCVLSPVAAEGIGLRSGYDCIIANTPQEWVDAVALLNEDTELWENVSQNARTLVRDKFSFVTAREEMRTAFESVNLFGAA